MDKYKRVLIGIFIAALSFAAGVSISSNMRPEKRVVPPFDQVQTELSWQFKEITLLSFFCAMGSRDQKLDSPGCVDYKNHLSKVEENMINFINYVGDDKKCGDEFKLSILMALKEVAEVIKIMHSRANFNSAELDAVMVTFSDFIASVDYKSCKSKLN